MCKLEIAKGFLECLIKGDFSYNIVESLLERDFFSLDKKCKSTYLFNLLNGLMLYNIEPETIVSIFNCLMKLDSYKRTNVTIANIPNSIVLECTGSGKKPYKTLNISTPSIITAVASGASIIKKGSGTTSSILGSSDLLYGLGLNKSLDNKSRLYLLQNTGFSFVDIEKVIPNFNSFYSGYFYKPHILSYILAADVTSLRGNKILYGLSNSDVMKCCKCLICNNSCDDITVYCSTENEKEYFDELIGDGVCYVARTKLGSPPKVSQYTIKAPSPTALSAAITPKASINAVVELFKYHNNRPYYDVVCQNAAFYLLEAGVADSIQEGEALAMESILSGRAYKKLIEIIKYSGGRPTWDE